MTMFHEPERGSTLQVYEDINLVVLNLYSPKDDGARGCFNLTLDQVEGLREALSAYASKAAAAAAAMVSSKLARRRNDLAATFGINNPLYENLSVATQRALDRIIELEDKLEENK